MKSSFAVSAAAALANAYVIDLCPSEAQVTPIYMPSAQSLLERTRDEGFMLNAAVGSHTQYDTQCDDSSDYEDMEDKLELLGRLEQLSQMQNMYKAQQFISTDQRIGDSMLMQKLGAINQFDVMNKIDAANKLDEMTKLATLRQIGSIRDQDFLLEQDLVGQYMRQQVGSQTYNPLFGVVERESFLPGASKLGQKIISNIPGADRSDSWVTEGISYVPDSYTPGSYQFDANCIGQDVITYPDVESRVLWCGERDLQGNQTLKRTNIHHNYVHDINHDHNYHNRTRHAAKQFNTVEKDCSCKGVSKAATYVCPPGIEAPGARTVGSSFLNRAGSKYQTVGALALDATCEQAAAYKQAAAFEQVSTCPCNK